jgi:ribosomal RNA-processing protein 8
MRLTTRWINELFYKTSSGEALQMVKDDPNMYAEVILRLVEDSFSFRLAQYHTGFRHQVKSWPTNPVSHYISSFSTLPPKTIIADLGCGDAALARALLPKGLTVMSFDLMSDGSYVVEADICAHVPLPGSEIVAGARGEGEGAVVDVVVCALSLMGTNWVHCIREAWRILKPGYGVRDRLLVERTDNCS